MSHTQNKTVLIGPEHVGKSTLIYRLKHDIFDQHGCTTIGATFFRHVVKLKGENNEDSGGEIKLDIWDTAGQTRFSHMLPLFLKEAKVVLVCFEQPTIHEIVKFVNIARDHDCENIVLVVTKTDLHTDSQCSGPLSMSLYQNIIRYAQDENYPLYFTSSLTGDGVKQLFDDVALLFLASRELMEEGNVLSFDNDDAVDKSNCCKIL